MIYNMTMVDYFTIQIDFTHFLFLKKNNMKKTLFLIIFFFPFVTHGASGDTVDTT